MGSKQPKYLKLVPATKEGGEASSLRYENIDKSQRVINGLRRNSKEPVVELQKKSRRKMLYFGRVKRTSSLGFDG